MKEQTRIPTGKVQRAAKFVSTGARIGGNYLKHNVRKAMGQNDQDQLHEDNAEDIYNALSELKGSALKVAQMMSMDKNMLPGAYQQRFTMAQYSAPPLSYPLVVKTFQKQFGKGPDQLFDSFTKNAVNAASIGQVHQATLDGKKLAVKIQYPGVADSISSDLKLVRPLASRILNISSAELDHYMSEVESKLLEETDYDLELRRGQEITQALAHLPNLQFPTYYPELSSTRILTMDWMEGLHIPEFNKSNPSQELRNRVGQAMWDFYHHQIHELRQVHADPHPGNFIIAPDGTLGVIDFGCVKELPEAFYKGYFRLLPKGITNREEELMKLFYSMDFLYEGDTQEDIRFFVGIFKEMIGILGRPFHSHSFDFADDVYFRDIYEMGDRIGRSPEYKKARQARGPKDALYVNRTYFGLYNLLNQLQAQVTTTKPEWMTEAIMTS